MNEEDTPRPLEDAPDDRRAKVPEKRTRRPELPRDEPPPDDGM